MDKLDKLIEEDIYNLIIKIMNSKNNPNQKTKFNIVCDMENDKDKNDSIQVECEFNLLKFNGEKII
jgi:hypothetical protein